MRNPHYRRSRAASGQPSRIARLHPAEPLRRSTGALPRRFRRLRLAVVGAGDVGSRLVARLWQSFGDRIGVLATTRQPDQAARLRALGARPLAVDLDDRRALARLGRWPQWLVQLAPPPGAGSDDTRSRHLLAALARPSGARRRSGWPPDGCIAAIYASTTGVYGDLGGRWADETQTPAPSSERARRRLAAEKRWRTAGRSGRMRAAIVRVPGIYAGDRLPTERLRKHLPALLEAEDVFTNHIHADDLAWILWLACLRGRCNRLYHAVDDSDLRMGDYFDQVADALSLPRPPRRSRAEIAREVSPAMLSFMNESRRLHNRRLRRELRAQLLYPTVQSTLAAC